MADNVQLSAAVGLGSVIAADDIGGILFPRNKLVFGVDGVNSGDVALANGLPIQPATGAVFAVTGAFFQATQPVSGTFFQATQPISAAALPLPSGAATAALQGTEISALASIDARLAGTLVVSLTSTTITGTVAATQSGVWNVTNISGTISLPTGASTEATLASLNAKVTAVNTGAVVISAALPAGTNNIGDVDVLTLPAVTLAAAQTLAAVTAITNALPAGNNNIGDVDVATLPALVAGSAIIGKAGIDQTTPGTTNAVQDLAGVSGGLSISSFLSTAAVQATAVKASPGQVYSLEFFNISATPVYVRLYNMTTTPGTGDTVVWRGVVPGNTAGAGFVKTWDKGLVFSTGIGMRCTGAIADNDNTSLAANVILGNVCFK